ncbi:hypothetical protein HYW41_02620 [Candidatus Daviesbacteria bacterium]|nr:hypothetical protein [Candidatus Daviesbacteria bacterium]
MDKFMDHVKKSSIELIENTSHLMINDTYSFIFLRSEGLEHLKEHSLGGGNLLMVIGQFAVLSFLAKVYLILKNGDSPYISEKDIEQYNNDVNKVKETSPETWKQIKMYCKKPRLWEVNETKAFTQLISDFPENIGIPKEKDSIEKAWNDFRNKISHIATIANGNTALVFEFQEGQSFKSSKKFLDEVKEKSFLIRSQKERDKIRKEIIAENNQKGIATSTSLIASATYNQIRPDLLSRDIQKIMQWLMGKIKQNEFKDDNIKSLYDWLLMQHYVNR